MIWSGMFDWPWKPTTTTHVRQITLWDYRSHYCFEEGLHIDLRIVVVEVKSRYMEFFVLGVDIL